MFIARFDGRRVWWFVICGISHFGSPRAKLCTTARNFLGAARRDLRALSSWRALREDGDKLELVNIGLGAVHGRYVQYACMCMCVRVCVCVCYVQAADIQPAFVFAHRQSFVREAAGRKTEPVEKAGTKEIEITRGNATGDGSYSFFTRSQSTGLIKNYFPTKRLSGVTANSFPSRFGNFSERDVHTFLLCFSSANSLCFFFYFYFFFFFVLRYNEKGVFTFILQNCK